MRTKLLLIYAYILPCAGSLLVAALPAALPFIDYADISSYYRGNLGISLCLLALAIAVSFPFQSKILHEDDPHVLGVLLKSHVRRVFRTASVIQVVTILLLSLLLTILATMQTHPEIVGFIQLWSSCLIVFESLALISNGIAYGKIRERIIDATNKALRGTAGSRARAAPSGQEDRGLSL
jgi:hypothetical protein